MYEKPKRKQPTIPPPPAGGGKPKLKQQPPVVSPYQKPKLKRPGRP